MFSSENRSGLAADINLLSSGEEFPVILIREDVPSGGNGSIHRHEDYELRFHRESENGRFTLLEVIFPGVLHCRMDDEENLRSMVIIFGTGCFRYSHGQKLTVNSYSPYMGQVAGVLENFSGRDCTELRLLLALMLLKSEDVSGNLRGRADAASLIRYLEQHYYRQDLTIAYLAEMAGYSPNYLQKIFAAAAGCRPKEYLQKYRLEMAAKFLRENRYPVKEVAAMCGFSDAHYFANAFRKYYGCTPSEFRISVTPAP